MLKTKSLKIISVLLALIMAFSFLTIPVRAEALMAAAAAIVLGLAVGAIAELSAGLISQAVESGVEAYQDVVSSCRSAFHNLVQNNNSILVSYWVMDPNTTVHDIDRVYPNSSLTGDELEIAQAICDAINNSGNIKQYLSYNALSDTLVLTTEGYEQMKKQVVNAWLSVVREKAGAALQEDVGVPTYDFDFVGPIQGATFPSGTTRTGLQKGDFYFTSPVRYNGTSYMTKAEAALFIPSLPSGWYTSTLDAGDKGVQVSFNIPNLLYTSVYVIYDNKLFYYKRYTGGGDLFPYYGFFSDLSDFVSKDGVVLSTLTSNVNGLPIGLCFNTNSDSKQYYPDDDISDDDFNAITGGGTIDIPLTDDEAALVGGLGFGLLNRDSLLGFNADGSLASADGIPIDKLQQILEALQNGTLEFDDIQSYLQTMSTLIANGNLTASEQKKLLDNVATNVEALAGDISAIRDFADSLAETKTENLDFDTSSTTIIDKFPFSIPFDFYNIITLLVENPKEPIFYFKVQTTMNVGGLNQKIDETIEIDLTRFKYNGYDIVRMITNATSIILFVACLITGTKKLIWK